MLNKVGIVRLSALGDVVLLVPTVRMLQRTWPAAEITWITCNPASKILDGLSGVRIESIDKPASFKDYWRLWQRFKEDWFDVLLCMQASFRSNLIYPLIPAARKIGFDSKRGKDGHRWFVWEQIDYRDEHLLDGFLGFARYLGAPDGPLDWGLAIDAEHERFADEQLPSGRWIAINPSASKSERNWPVERFLEFVQKVRARWPVNIVLTGGSDHNEEKVAKRIAMDVGVLNLVGKTTPKQLAAILGRVSVLVAPDTGPVHIAISQNTPVVGLYAVARPQLSGPYGQLDFTVNCYPQAVREFLGKDAAEAGWHERVHCRQAMSLISVDAVVQKLARVLQNGLTESETPNG